MIAFWVFVVIFGLLGLGFLGVPGIFIGIIIGAAVYRLTGD